MSDATNFTKLVPGFEFLQNLVKGAGSALPSIGQWVAPTLDPEELGKRIEELRTVQFWLEQNAKMLGATIQALEVQRMTLSTLKTMNVQLGDLREAMRIRLPDDAPASAPPPPGAAAKGARRPAPRRAAPKPPAAPPALPASMPGLVDPMQWWGALTRQFGELAAAAVKDGATDAAKNLAGTIVRQSIDTAGGTLKKAAGVPVAVARGAAGAVSAGARAVGATAREAAAPPKRKRSRRSPGTG